MLANVKCELRIVRAAITNRDSIIPSKHRGRILGGIGILVVLQEIL